MTRKSSKMTNKSAAAAASFSATARARAPFPVPFPVPTPVPVPPPVPSNYFGSAFTYQVRGASSSAASPHRGAVVAPPSLLPGHFVGASSSPSLLIPPGVSRDAYPDDLVRSVQKNILDLTDEDRRGDALAELCQKRKVFQDLAPYLWFSFGTVTILLQELVSIYRLLSPPCLMQAQSDRVCNVLVLLQCVAAHPTTRILFAKANMPYYLFAFLNTTDEPLSEPFESLMIATLKVIAALVKVPNTDVVVYLLPSEMMSLCLRVMQRGSQLSRKVSAFIVEQLLLNDVCLKYVCYLPERLFAVCHALGNVVASLVESPSTWCLKNVIRCYHHFLDDERSLWAMRNSFPKALTDGTFDHCLHGDQTTRMYLQQLLENIRQPPVTQLDLFGNYKKSSPLFYSFFWRAVIFSFLSCNQFVDVDGIRTHGFVIAEDKTLDLHPNIATAY